MWKKSERGWRFLPGRNAENLAAQQAEMCPFFRMDDDEECVAEEDTSCFNCLYRRWTKYSFDCLNTEVSHD